MQITPQSLRDLRTAINLALTKGRGMATPKWARFATKVTSATKHTNFPIHAATRRLRRWEGERKEVNGKAYDYQVTPEKFELTASIPLEELEDDNIAAWAATLQDMGVQVEMWPDDLVFELMLAAESELCFDGKPFFANDHELKSGVVIDNLFASTALTKPNVAAVIAEMKSWVGEDGRALRVTPNVLVVPPALEDTGLEIVGANLFAKVFGSNTAAAAIDNTMAGRLTLEVCPELAADAGGSDDDWYVKDTTKSTKPYVFVERSAPKIVNKNAENDDNVFWDDKVVTGVRARGAAGFGPFWLAAKCKG